jgi:hypothetical protein
MVLVAAVLSSTGAALGSSAHPLERQVVTDRGSFVDTSTCGLPIKFSYLERARIRHFDAQGEPVRHGLFFHIAVYDAANGVTLHENDAFSNVIDLRSGREWVVGLQST